MQFCFNRYDPTKFCWATLNHVQNGTNYFTGERGIEVAFLSLHEKVANKSKKIHILITTNLVTTNTHFYEQFPLHLFAPCKLTNLS